MSTGGIFKLITNDGKQDRLIMATDLLQNRLAAISAARAASGKVADPTPTLSDIEKTHILFMNAHFKPYCAIGYEYNKVPPQAGNVALGSTVLFSIPQFGDFFSDMALHVVLKQPTIVPSPGIVDSDSPLMRWCSYPGERLCQNVQFNVNANPLDEYTFNSTNFHRIFQVAPNKKAGWDKLVGQELPLKGFVDQPNWIRSGVAAADVDHRTAAVVSTGNQTPTGQKDTSAAGYLEMIIPLLFWFNRDPRLAIPSVAIPYGQRFLNITLATQAQMVDLYPRGSGDWSNPNGTLSTSENLISKIELYVNNIFVNPEVHSIYIKRIGFSLIRVHREQIYAAQNPTDQVLLQQLKWPIEYMQVGMRIDDYNSTNPALNRQYLDVWHTFTQIVNESYGDTGFNCYRYEALTGTSVEMDTTSIPGQGTVIGVGTQFLTELAPGDFIVINWVPFPVEEVALPAVNPVSNLVLSVGDAKVGMPPVDILATSNFYKYTLAPKTYTVQREVKTIDYVSITAHGIAIYDNFPAMMFNAYQPYQFGGPNLNTPEDSGALFITYCLYPNSYQPSGHINISRAREFYIQYVSSVINSTTRGALVVVASAINFLLISDGSAVLRYST